MRLLYFLSPFSPSNSKLKRKKTEIFKQEIYTRREDVFREESWICMWSRNGLKIEILFIIIQAKLWQFTKKGPGDSIAKFKKELGSFSLLSNLFKKAVPKYLPFHAPLGVVVIDCSCRILIDIASNDHKTTTAKLPKVFLDLFQKVDTKSGHLTSPIFLYSAQKF